jgi:hypothetical protein
MKIRRHAPNVYVIKTDEPEEVRRFFEAFGLSFQNEKHGDGPAHVSCERSGQVLEIYPEGRHEAAAAVKSEPDFDGALWFTEDGCDGRHFISDWANPHTFPGRIRAWCPTKRVHYNCSKAQMRESSPETKRWVEGYLAGNEPRPPEDEEGFPESTSPAGLAWVEKARAFRSTGLWPNDEPSA